MPAASCETALGRETRAAVTWQRASPKVVTLKTVPKVDMTAARHVSVQAALQAALRLPLFQPGMCIIYLPEVRQPGHGSTIIDLDLGLDH